MEDLERERFEQEYYAEYVQPYEAVDSWLFTDFIKGWDSCYMAADYYPYTEGGEPCLVFRKRDGSEVRVFNPDNLTVQQIKEHKGILYVELRKSGYYVLCGYSPQGGTDLPLPFEATKKDSSYWDDYDNAEHEQHCQKWSDCWSSAAEENAAEETRHNLEGARLKRMGEKLWDVSGDDLSLNIEML